MLELLIFIVGLIIGYQIGGIVMALKVRNIIVENAKENGMDISELEDTVPEVKQLLIENTNDTLYLYDKTAGSFVCQGKDMNELAKFAFKYKNIKHAIVLDKEEKEVCSFVNGEAKY